MVHFLLQSAAEAATEVAQEATEVVSTAANEGLIGQALQITLIGMLILFISLLVLWGVMELLVRLVKDNPQEEVAEEAPAAAVVETAAEDDLKQKAAAAAAAYVIAKK